jgi:lipoprotein-anchoring transpeptidase ErfK/SrfK
VRGAIGLVILVGAAAVLRAQTAVEIDLRRQTASLIKNGQVVMTTPIASGRYGHLTPTGSFTILDKEMNHYSSMYGKIVDRNGNTVVTDADADMRVPAGGRFIAAPMRYFMRFEGANGMHAGILPGYPASHGCVRLPEQNAIAFFNSVEVGTPVTVFGTTPRSGYSNAWESPRRTDRVYDPRYGPYYDPRYRWPWSR